ncbi:hypothetical protein JCM8547_008320 [Rhodosporidiobolus lusitaniae]
MDALPPVLHSLSDQAKLTVLAGFIGAVLVLAKVPSVVEHLRWYVSFLLDHEAALQSAAKKKYHVAPFKSPFPGTPHTQYFLLTQKFAKAMFANSAALDHRDSIDAMHDLVWDVPMNESREITKGAEKIMGRSLVKSKIGPMVSLIEQNSIDHINKLREAISPVGAAVPFAHRSWSLLWDCSVGALFGHGLDPTSVRGPAREMMHNANICYVIELLPILPRAFWYAVLPKARSFLKGRKDLHETLGRWMEDSAAVDQAEPMIQEITKCLMQDPSRCNLREASAWMAMFGSCLLFYPLTGLAVNTGEVTGWMFPFLIRAPKLYQAIRDEVDALPAGRLDELDLKALCPLLSSAIQETLRVRGSIFSGRTVKQPFALPGHNHSFRAGDLLRIMSPAARYDTECWGEDAAAWKGDRFQRGGETFYNAQLAFGGGATTCPGRWLATHELQIVIAHLIRNFDFSNVELHEKLPDEGDDLAIGRKLPSQTGTLEKVIDLDGKEYEVRVPDQENSGCEIPSGILPPLQEPVIFMRPREVDA